jgi:hypothetical protein
MKRAGITKFISVPGSRFVQFGSVQNVPTSSSGAVNVIRYEEVVHLDHLLTACAD